MKYALPFGTFLAVAAMSAAAVGDSVLDLVPRVLPVGAGRPRRFRTSAETATSAGPLCTRISQSRRACVLAARRDSLGKSRARPPRPSGTGDCDSSTHDAAFGIPRHESGRGGDCHRAADRCGAAHGLAGDARRSTNARARARTLAALSAAQKLESLAVAAQDLGPVTIRRARDRRPGLRRFRGRGRAQHGAPRLAPCSCAGGA